HRQNAAHRAQAANVTVLHVGRASLESPDPCGSERPVAKLAVRARYLDGVESLPLLRLCHKSISHSTHREQMARLGGIVFDIAPQADDEIVYGARVCVFVQAPDFFQN